MLQNIYWFKIAEQLRDFLKAYRYSDGSKLFSYFVDADDLKIRIGSGNTGEYPQICILFGDEGELKKQDDIIGSNLQLWIDIYVKGQASNDIDYDDIGYRQEYMAQQEFVKILREFKKDLARRGLATNLKILDILSDGDTNLPVSVQNRIVLNIQIREK